MIPPVEERQFRPCDDCHCCCDDDGNPDCTISSDAFYIRIGGYDFDETIGKLVQIQKNKSEPCKYHLTHDEYRELIDSGPVLHPCGSG